MEEARLLELLAGFRRRVRWVRLGEAAARWALIGAALSLAAALVLKIVGFGAAGVSASLAALAICPLIAAVFVLLAPLPIDVVARRVDARAALAERVSTAVEWVLQRRGQTLMSRAQLRDAVAALAPLQPKSTFPHVRPRRAALALPLMLGVLVLVAIPRWTFFAGSPVALAPPDLTKPAEALEQAAEALTPRTPDAPPLPELVRTADELKELAREMRQGEMSEREALARIAEAREAVEHSLEDARREAEAAAAGKGAAEKSEKPDDKPAPGGGASRQTAAPQKSAAQQKGDGQQKGQPTSAEREARRKALSQKAAALEKAQGRLEQARACVNGQVAQNQGDSPQSRSAANGPTANKPGEGKDGQAPSQNTGQATKPGKGKGDADFGKGTTDQQQQGKAIKPRTTVLERQSAERKQWTVAYKKLYGAERKSLESAPTQVKGDRTEQGEHAQTTEEVRAAPDAASGSSVDERDVYVDARRRAEESMARETVPEEYRDLVRSYFEEINPGDSRRQEK